MNSLATEKSNSENMQHQNNELFIKLTAEETEQISLSQKLDHATMNHDAIEKQHILDQASDDEVTRAQQLCEELTEKLAATNRRIDLIKTARSELASKIASARQRLTIARRDHCIQIRDSRFKGIKVDKKFKAAILEAMAANCANGVYQYTNSPINFFQQYAAQILPEISEEEVRAVTDDFKKSNELD